MVYIVLKNGKVDEVFSNREAAEQYQLVQNLVDSSPENDEKG